jgi:hypothetical protein
VSIARGLIQHLFPATKLLLSTLALAALKPIPNASGLRKKPPYHCPLAQLQSPTPGLRSNEIEQHPHRLWPARYRPGDRLSST